MTAPDPATEAAAKAIYAVYSDVRSSWIEWPNINDEAKGYFRQLAAAALDAARPHFWSQLSAYEAGKAVGVAELRQRALEAAVEGGSFSDEGRKYYAVPAELLEGGT